MRRVLTIIDPANDLTLYELSIITPGDNESEVITAMLIALNSLIKDKES